MGQMEYIHLISSRFFQQEPCQPLIKSDEQQLLHRPHHIGKSLHGLAVDKILKPQTGFHQMVHHGSGNQNTGSIGFRVNKHFKRDFFQHTGGRKGADFAGIQTI
jgi:hypothetical protein